MSYDIQLKDPVTGKTIEFDKPHMMTGGTYAVGGTREAWLNITYNYAKYYYEATDKDERFAHDEVSAYYADGTKGEIVTEYGIRGIYGKTGAESIGMLNDMISRIKDRYQKDGKWISTERKEPRYIDTETGRELDLFMDIIKGKMPKENYRKEEYIETVNEGSTGNYWKDTAANAIRPLTQLIALAQMRPDGVWDGD